MCFMGYTKLTHTSIISRSMNCLRFGCQLFVYNLLKRISVSIDSNRSLEFLFHSNAYPLLKMLTCLGKHVIYSMETI